MHFEVKCFCMWVKWLSTSQTRPPKTRPKQDINFPATSAIAFTVPCLKCKLQNKSFFLLSLADEKGSRKIRQPTNQLTMALL